MPLHGITYFYLYTLILAISFQFVRSGKGVLMSFFYSSLIFNSFSQHDGFERTLRGSVTEETRRREREFHGRQIQDRVSGGRLFQANCDRLYVPDDRRDVRCTTSWRALPHSSAAESFWIHHVSRLIITFKTILSRIRDDVTKLSRRICQKKSTLYSWPYACLHVSRIAWEETNEVE